MWMIGGSVIPGTRIDACSCMSKNIFILNPCSSILNWMNQSMILVLILLGVQSSSFSTAPLWLVPCRTVVASRLKVRPGNAWRKPRRSIRVCRLWAPWTLETADPMGDTPLDPLGNLLCLNGKSPLFWWKYLQMGHGLDCYVRLLVYWRLLPLSP